VFFAIVTTLKTGTFAARIDALRGTSRKAHSEPETAHTMHTLFDTRRMTHAALKAARPARRHVVRALRHHAARTRALAQQVRDASAVDGMRTWFHSFFSVLRQRAGARHFSLRTLLYRPNSTLRALAAPATVHTVRNTRLPRRMGASSTGWFGFAMR
jgi:hypothetical protein